MKWVTRARPVIDRIACPWLIARFIDKEAEFLFVAPDRVQAVAEETGGGFPMTSPASSSAMLARAAASTNSSPNIGWRSPHSMSSPASCAAPIPSALT